MVSGATIQPIPADRRPCAGKVPVLSYECQSPCFNCHEGYCSSHLSNSSAAALSRTALLWEWGNGLSHISMRLNAESSRFKRISLLTATFIRASSWAELLLLQTGAGSIVQVSPGPAHPEKQAANFPIFTAVCGAMRFCANDCGCGLCAKVLPYSVSHFFAKLRWRPVIALTDEPAERPGRAIAKKIRDLLDG